MGRWDVLGFKPLPVEMKSESSQQKHITKGVEVAYVGRHIVVGSVTEVRNDCFGIEEQVGGSYPPSDKTRYRSL